MNILIDPHVHYYKEFEQNSFISTILDNLQKLNDSNQATAYGFVSIKVHNQSQFLDDLLNLNDSELKNWGISSLLKLNDYTEITLSDNRKIYGFYGSQTNTLEKIELLSLFSKEEIKVKQTLANSISAIRTNGGIATINWAPGKWLGKRGEIIKEYLKEDTKVILSSTKMYSCNSILNKILALDLFLNYNTKCKIVGSDPLPLSMDFKLAGKAALYLKDIRSISNQEICSMLIAGNFTNLIEPSSTFEVISRIFRYEFYRKLKK